MNVFNDLLCLACNCVDLAEKCGFLAFVVDCMDLVELCRNVLLDVLDCL